MTKTVPDCLNINMGGWDSFSDTSTTVIRQAQLHSSLWVLVKFHEPIHLPTPPVYLVNMLTTFHCSAIAFAVSLPHHNYTIYKTDKNNPPKKRWRNANKKKISYLLSIIHFKSAHFVALSCLLAWFFTSLLGCG